MSIDLLGLEHGSHCLTVPVSVLAEVGAWAEENVPGVFSDSYVAKENQVLPRTNSHDSGGVSAPVSS